MPSLEARLGGTRAKHIGQELFANSAHFPLANIFPELLLEGLPNYVTGPDPYILIAASLVQACFLGSWQHANRPHPFLGNLIGPALYTVIEASIEGPAFFVRPHHLAYWGFSVAIGGMQRLRLSVPRNTSVGEFLSDRSHLFVAVVIPLLGLIIGLANITAMRYLATLRETAAQLRGYSEWLLGRAASN